MAFWKRLYILVWKDFLVEWRTKEIFTAVSFFSLLVIIIFNFAFEPGMAKQKEIGAGILWVAFTFAGILGLNRSFLMEKEGDCLQGLILCPVDRGTIYLGKMITNILFMTFVEIITLVIFVILFNLNIFSQLPSLLLVMILGTIGFVAVGTLFSAMAVNTRIREVMLPILLLPVVVPVIIAAVKATGKILAASPLAEISSWLRLLVGFDLIFIILCYLTFEYVLEE
jgi:heme exporter protein B